MQPTVVIYVGRARDWYFYGPGTNAVTGDLIYDFSSFTTVKFTCPDLAITKESDDPAEAEVKNSGADVLLHFLEADTTGKTPKPYDAELVGVDAAGEEHVIWQGTLDLRAAVE